jgi:acetate kinase
MACPQAFALPRRLSDAGIRRYGFHDLPNGRGRISSDESAIAVGIILTDEERQIPALQMIFCKSQ